MTKSIHLTNLKDITTIRFKCNKCRAVIEVSATEWAVNPKECFNCAIPFSYRYRKAWENLMDTLMGIKVMVESNNHDVDIEFITETTQE